MLEKTEMPAIESFGVVFENGKFQVIVNEKKIALEEKSFFLLKSQISKQIKVCQKDIAAIKAGKVQMDLERAVEELTHWKSVREIVREKEKNHAEFMIILKKCRVYLYVDQNEREIKTRQALKFGFGLTTLSLTYGSYLVPSYMFLEEEIEV